MDTTLVTVTLLSMGMAAALSVIVWRMLRDERQRSEARVVRLAAASGQHASRGPLQPPAGKSSGSSDDRGRHGGRAAASDLVLREDPMVPTANLFTEPKQSSPWGGRFAVMAGLALVLASGVLLTLTVNDRTGAQARPAAANAAAGASPGANAASTIGLELLSLRDSRQTASLTITGLVQNPRGGAPLSRVTVTAYAFDDKGSFLASGRALIDVTTLAPGDESPFVVTVPVTDTVARYRIGFRGEDGRVIAHIDKRQQASVAALRPASGQANW
jgi:hypothetical protein